MSFYGVVGLSVWLLGTKLGYPVTDRIVIVVLILLTMPFALLAGYVSTRRAKKKEAIAKAEAEAKAAEVPSGEVAPEKIAAPIGNYDDLNKSAEETVQFLKNSNLGVNGKDAVYTLPWYIVAGTPKSGKSSLVLSSNLNFQTLPSQRQSEQKFVRPTGNIDWRVTNDAVFVDTAGRYQAEGIDGEEWSAMLETVKKHRQNRPLDGFLLVVDAEKILNSDGREIEETAKILRARLDDAIQRLKVRFPVYLVFTHADAIEGFRDSFSTSKNEGAALVWGSTIPLEKSESAAQMFDGEYEILHNSIMKRRIVRLSAPFSPVRQLRIFNFPLHFGAARRKLGTFVSTLFRPNPFSENPFLRGFYFTAAPVKSRSEQTQNAPQTIGTTYFTERFFRDVILRDKDLVRTFQEQKQRKPIWGWLLTLAGAVLVTTLLVMAGVSLYKNKQMLENAKVQGENVLAIVRDDAGKNPLEKKEDETRREIRATEDLLKVLTELDKNEREGAPWDRRFGLYSGSQIYKKNLLPIYFNVVEQRFKNPTIERVEAELRKFAASAQIANSAQMTDAEEQMLDKNYDLLKAYLMLTGEYKGKAEAGHISETLKDYWTAESKLPADLHPTAQQMLVFWAKQVDRDEEELKFPRIQINDERGKLIADTRRKLQAFPAIWRYYKEQVTKISKEVDDTVGATTTVAILTRNSADTTYLEGSYTVPSAYTLEGYKLMETAIAEADQKLSEDDWVMGELGKKQIAQTTDAGKLKERYFRDYADHWRNFIKGVNVKPYKNKTDAVNALEIFSLKNSPMRILLAEINRNTNLSAKPEAPGWWERFMRLFRNAETPATGGGTPVEKEFKQLALFMNANAQGEATIDKYEKEIGDVFSDIDGKTDEDFKKIAQALETDETLEIRRSEKEIKNSTKGFNDSLSAQELAILLQEPLGNLRTLLGGGVKDQIKKTWAEQILVDAKEIEKGFPFEDSQTDSDLNKLKIFLNPTDGKFTMFYKERLSKYFEESNGKLKVKDASEAQFSDEFVAYLNNAFALQKALFGTNPTPRFEYEFQLKSVKDALIEIKIDGETITSGGTGSSKLSFPSAATETGVFMNLVSTSGTSSTSGAVLQPANTPANTSANTSPANVNTTNTSRFAQNSNAGSSSNDSLKFSGNWGLFRFVDAGSPQKQPGGEYVLTYDLGGKKVAATVKPMGGDLFDKSIFRSMKAPPNILK